MVPLRVKPGTIVLDAFYGIVVATAREPVRTYTQWVRQGHNRVAQKLASGAGCQGVSAVDSRFTAGETCCPRCQRSSRKAVFVQSPYNASLGQLEQLEGRPVTVEVAR